MGRMMVLSQNGWVQSISGLKKHRNRAPTCHNTIHIGFSYFSAKIPTLRNGRGPEMGHMMVLSQNPGLKKHRNRAGAPTCYSSLSIRFSMFVVKILMLKNGRGPRTPKTSIRILAATTFCLQTLKVHIPEEKISTGVICRNRAKAMSFLFYPKIPTMKKGVAVIWSRDGPSAITMIAIDLSVENM